MERRTFKIHADDDGSRLDRWCQRILGRVPNSIYQKALRKGDIRLNGKKAEGSTRVEAGQEVEVRGTWKVEDLLELARKAQMEGYVPPTAPPQIIDAEAEALARSWVLHRDKDILIISKPPGLAVQGGSKVSKHLDGMLPALQFEASEVPRLVHRLDKDTSGIMILARTRHAAVELQRAFANKKIQKTYLALVVGVPAPYSGEIVSNLDKLTRGEHSREMVRSVEEDEGKRAITRYRTREHLAKKIALVELEPITGRTHQLRVHMAEMECPILGDGKYGGAAAHIKGSVRVSGKLHLHAWRLELPAMFGEKSRAFVAPLPTHMQQSMDALGLTLE